MSSNDDNRAQFERFIDLFYRQGAIREAFETCVAENYIQHNPQAGDGRDGAIAFLEGMLATMPGASIDVKRVLVDGDLCAVHSNFKPSPEEPGFAEIDIFRIENGKIAEHWDVMQPVPAESTNSNGMF